MADQDAIPSLGIELEYTDPAAPGAKKKFPRLVELTLPESAVPEIDVTHHKSPGQTFIPVPLPQGGEIQGKMFWLDEDEAMLRALKGKKTSWTGTSSTGAKWEFKGFLRSYTPGTAGLETAEERSFAIRVDGGSTFTPGAA